MFRNRVRWTALLVLAILPLVGCANRRSYSPSCSNRPVVMAAPPCSSCPAPAAPPAVIGQ